MTQAQENKATVIATLEKIKSILVKRNSENELDCYIQQCNEDLKNIEYNQNVKLEKLNLYDLGLMYFENRGGDWKNDELLKLMFSAYDFIEKVKE